MEDILIASLHKSYSRDLFSCGNAALDEFLKLYASQHQKRNISKTYVAVEKGGIEKEVVGYYSLTSGQIDHVALPAGIKHPRYPVSIARIARLAVTRSFQGKGLGGYLLLDVLKKTMAASQLMGIYGVVVDAKDETARSFYEHYGFEILEGIKKSELTLFLSMSVINELF